jgi:hypothetical protein
MAEAAAKPPVEARQRAERRPARSAQLTKGPVDRTARAAPKLDLLSPGWHRRQDEHRRARLLTRTRGADGSGKLHWTDWAYAYLIFGVFLMFGPVVWL